MLSDVVLHDERVLARVEPAVAVPRLALVQRQGLLQPQQPVDEGPVVDFNAVPHDDARRGVRRDAFLAEALASPRRGRERARDPVEARDVLEQTVPDDAPLHAPDGQQPAGVQRERGGVRLVDVLRDEGGGGVDAPQEPLAQRALHLEGHYVPIASEGDALLVGLVARGGKQAARERGRRAGVEVEVRRVRVRAGRRRAGAPDERAPEERARASGLGGDAGSDGDPDDEREHGREHGACRGACGARRRSVETRLERHETFLFREGGFFEAGPKTNVGRDLIRNRRQAERPSLTRLLV